jgi:hypothetical protein
MNFRRGYFPIVLACYALSTHCFAADVLTYHNDNARTGLNSSETTLTPQNVNASSFGLIRNLPVDGAVYAQPLYVSNAQVFSAGQSLGSHNLVIVATEHDSVYAFDADSGTMYWRVSMLGAGEVPSDPLGCGDITPELGITSTPVIDRAMGSHGTIFVLAMSKTPNTTNYYDRLHALDIATGQDVLSPVTIQASYPGNGPNNDASGHVIFDPRHERGRAGLLLLNGTIYTEWGSFCDFEPFAGWIIAYNENTFAQTAVFNSNPNGIPPSSYLPDGSGGGIWQSGSPAAVDPAGNLYLATGNGPFDTNLNNGFPSNGDFGDSFLKLSANLKVIDYFTPFDQAKAAANDTDLSSGGSLVLDIADSGGLVHHLAIAAGKDNNIYVLNRDNVGKFNSGSNNIYQELPNALPGGVWSSPAYFNGSIYYEPQSHQLRQFKFSNAKLDPVPVSISNTTFPYPGGVPSISSSGNTNGIVWIQEFGNQAILHAYDATNLSNELYSSVAVNFGSPVKFSVPTVCNGKAFVATQSSVGVFGLGAPGPGNYISYSGDFNGDGKQDILWRSVNTGDTWIWLMNGTSIIGSASIGHVDLSWRIVGVGDFDGGGKRDILWYNASSGLISIWIMNGFTQIATHQFSAPVSANGQWQVVGVADFDHTGLADILWQDTSTGNLYMWKSVSPFNFTSIHLGPTVDPSWRVVGTADVEGNGRPDIIWHNLGTGEVYIWKLTNDQPSQAVSLGLVSLDNHMVGLADFNGDGKQDILWRNVSSGDVFVWGMNGLSIGTKWDAGIGSLAWVIVGTPALYGRSPYDVLWLNPTTGSVAAWIGSPSSFVQLTPFATGGLGYLPMPEPQ